MSTQASPEVRLEHAFLYVSDLVRSLAFYRQLLPDWEVRWEGQGEGGRRWIHYGAPGDGQPSYLSLYEEPTLERVEDLGERATVGHIGFAHPDVAALIARLEPIGIVPTDRVDDGRFRRAYFEDPDGHELELVQRL
jgi:catechol 2,3-dioxygenase-like lactoylglutathione lyase family enzyme